MTPKTIPVIQSHPMLGVMAQPASMRARFVRQFDTWAADNGCYAQGATFDAPRWLRWLASLRQIPGCLFATAPDVVADAAATWARSEPFIAQIRALGFKAALVAQDGLEKITVPWGAFDALFIGGSTTWKLSRHAAEVAREAKCRGLWVHMGRVNSLHRLRIAEEFACDSVDGNYLGFGPDANLPNVLRWLENIVADRAQGRLL